MIFPPVETDNVHALPVKPRPSPEEGAMLQAVPVTQCQHLFATYTIDLNAGKCICKRCSGDVTPMFVLEQLMKKESQWMRTMATYQDQMKRLAERSRTKCQHCGEMTRVSSR
jgi:formylmethanofuran dehydrogenase subunit E